MRYLTDGQPTEPSIIYEKALPRMMRFNKATHSYEYFAAIEKAGGEFIGWFHFRPPFDLTLAEPGEMELGYRLKRSAWGKGYATEAARAILKKG
jgi:RimJ/RimL family protein N-acetyltransferase